MISCSMIESLTERPSIAVVGLQDEHVVAADALAEAGPDLTVGELDDVRVPELDARGGRPPPSASSGCVRPEYSASFLVVTFSIVRLRRVRCDRLPLQSVGGSVERPGRRRPRRRANPAAGGRTGRPGRRRRPRPRARRCAGSRQSAPTTQSSRRVCGPISVPSPTTVLPSRIVPGYSVTSRPSCDGDVDERLAGVEHRDAVEQPVAVRAVAQLALGAAPAASGR